MAVAQKADVKISLGPTVSSCRVMVNDIDISHCVRGVKVKAGVDNRLTVVSLELVGNHVVTEVSGVMDVKTSIPVAEVTALTDSTRQYYLRPGDVLLPQCYPIRGERASDAEAAFVKELDRVTAWGFPLVMRR